MTFIGIRVLVSNDMMLRMFEVTLETEDACMTVKEMFSGTRINPSETPQTAALTSSEIRMVEEELGGEELEVRELNPA